MLTPKRVLISRTDNLGDVILTLPMAKLLKEYFPKAQVIFLGKTYTKPIIERCSNIDEFINWDKMNYDFVKDLNIDTIIHVFPQKEIALKAKKEKVPIRIGTSHRFYHLLNCNKKVNFSRKNSDLHESQLNIELLNPLGIINIPSKENLGKMFGLKSLNSINSNENWFPSKDKYNLILHPKSNGSAKEWGVENYFNLINYLPKEKFQIYITGTEKEEKELDLIINSSFDNVINLCGKFDLGQLIDFTGLCNGLVAASTGPLHIASALGIQTLGLFSPKKPIYPKRWAPIGINSNYLVFDNSCSNCMSGKDCNCIQKIPVEKVGKFFLDDLK